ncbi:MAG TPA: acyl-CoA synthetase [Ktedonobacteraceae bacterium]|nr:acyl-CoA synthetase [Ktedonobacteraceae bacterium]
MQSIVEALFQHAEAQPARPALLFEEQTISYGQLRAEVTRFADALARAGLRSGERVALFLGNGPAFVVAYLGIHLAGGVVVLVNTQYRQVELNHILNDAGVRFCVTDAAGQELLRSVNAPGLEHLVLVDEEPRAAEAGEAGVPAVSFSAFLASGSAQAAPAMPDGAAPALIGYTSGTTGLAKGALLLHRNLLANIQAVTTAWHWTGTDRLLLVLPLFHAHGLMVGMHGTLFTGGSALLRQKFEAQDVLATLKQDTSITLFFGVPTMYVRLLAEAERQGAPERPLRLYVSGSAPLSAQLFANFARVFGQPILERYGMTETIMNLTNPYEGERRAGTVGKPFPGQEARVVDVKSRQLLSPGEIGEIEVRGPHVFAGYWQRPDATAESFAEEGWFKTGDLGWRSEDGYYTITGRARELIISGGYNIYPREIEDVLAQHPAVAEVAVLGQPDPEMGEKVVAAIVLKTEQSADPDEIIAFCRARLASYKKPRHVVFVDLLPRNALGKVQKHLLAAQLPAL